MNIVIKVTPEEIEADGTDQLRYLVIEALEDFDFVDFEVEVEIK
jgi:hypothetical protein